MSKYIIKRLLICVMILFFVTLIIYSIMRCIPTSFVESIARERAALPGGKSYQEWLAQLNAAYGMDKGIIEGYFTNWRTLATAGSSTSPSLTSSTPSSGTASRSAASPLCWRS